MALAAGARLGPYEIQSLVGAGGMGEVYKARDTRLDRTVAVKILPPELASDPQFRERFDREARTISQLDHPHICALHDVGEQDGTAYLVMQYLEGETLAERLTKGALPLDQALRIAIDVADALDKAHRAGIIHRDLKPGNIFLTKVGAKLLDFGLAKSGQPVIVGTAASLLPTTPPMTQRGTILGTFQYMAPEQLDGAEADARTDLFAFGAVLYEMLTAKKAFEGNSQPTLIAAIVSTQPIPISKLQPLTPPALEHLVATCLAKKPDDRFDSAHDLVLQLKWILAEGSQVGVTAPIVVRRNVRDHLLLWGLATACVALTAILVGMVTANLRSQRPATARFLIPPPAQPVGNIGANIAVSPDGRHLAYIGAGSDGRLGLWVRPLNNVAGRLLPGTQGAFLPFWSPDSRFLGFFADGKLKKIEASGGPPQTICDSKSGLGGTWNAAGIILFAPGARSGLYRVADTGGVPTPVITPDASHSNTHASPHFLPDGRHFLFVAVATRPEIRVGSLDSTETKTVLSASSNAVYVQPGYVLFVRGGTLMAQSFDARNGTVIDGPFPIAAGVGSTAALGLAFFSASNDGVLAYQGVASESSLVWFDRNGRTVRTVGEPGDYTNPALSPDGAKLAVGRRDPQTGLRNIWVFNMQRTTASRFTVDLADDFNPVWSSDGSRILFTSDRKGQRDIYEKPTSGVGDEKLVFESTNQKNIDLVSSDDRYVVYDTGAGGAPFVGLWVLPMFGDRKAFPFIQTDKFNVRRAQLSPDNRWIAYTSDESGQDEVYVEAFPERRGKWQISTAGGSEPMWRKDERELFYLAGNKIVAVDTNAGGDQFQPGIPKSLFETHPVATIGRNRYVVAADGQRFLINISSEQGAASPITVVVNWTTELLNK